MWDLFENLQALFTQKWIIWSKIKILEDFNWNKPVFSRKKYTIAEFELTHWDKMQFYFSHWGRYHSQALETGLINIIAAGLLDDFPEIKKISIDLILESLKLVETKFLEPISLLLLGVNF